VGDVPKNELSNAAEATVIALACAGDSFAFEVLVRRRHSRVRSFLYYLCRDPAEGDDLAQQVFLKAWRSIRQLRSVSTFDGWLKKIMVTTWLESVRRNRINFDEQAELDESISGHASSAGERIDLDAALAQLPPAMRICVVLAYEEGMTHEEIEAMTSIPLGTVKSNIVRGSARMREVLLDYRKRSKS